MADTISGITQFNGTPTQARVTLVNVNTNTIVSSQLSNATTGAFSFTGLAAGTYEIVIIKAGYKARCDGPWVLDGYPPNVTWNPEKKGSLITLSSGDRTATGGSGGAYQTVLATHGKSSGKHYFEVLFVGTNASNFNLIGVCGDLVYLDLSFHTRSDGFAYYEQTGWKYNNSAGAAYGAAYTAGDVVGVLLDATAGALEFFKNGVSQGVAFTAMPAGTYYPALGLYGQTPNASMTGRFKASDFTQSIPSGALAWGV